MSVSFIFQSIKGMDRFDSVMVHFGAVMGINEEGSTLMLGDRCSFKFAGFIYCIRVLFLEQSPHAHAEDMTARILIAFLEMRAKYLVVGGYNPTGERSSGLGMGKVMSLGEDQPAQHYVGLDRKGEPAGWGHLVLSRQASAHPPIQNRGPRHGWRGGRYCGGI